MLFLLFLIPKISGICSWSVDIISETV